MDRELGEEVKEVEERRRVEVRGAGGVARDRRANAELVRRAFMLVYFGGGESQHQFRPFCLVERVQVNRKLQPRE